MRVWIIMVGLLVAQSASAADDLSGVSELEAKIAKNLSSDRWNEASKAFVGTLWIDYKNAHRSPAQDRSVGSVFGKMPDVQNPAEYEGSYYREKNSSRPFLSISSTKDGRFFVDLEGHRIPAVYRNRSIIFTTGDIVYSPIPMFGAKPYCTLEMFILFRIEGEFSFASPGTPPEKWRKLSKGDVKE